MHPANRYEILGEIGSGAMATVFLAEDVLLRRKVALKVLHPHLSGHAQMVLRFKTEAVAIALLSHENVIRIFDSGTQADKPFLAMEYIDGPNLETLLLSSPECRLPNLVAVAVVRQILHGLAAAHAIGIYHRDIKPINILLDKKGKVHIADFGIAYLKDEASMTRTGVWSGTLSYSAPEQVDGRPATDKTDVFAAGIVLYRCLTGRLPFEADSTQALLFSILQAKPPRLFEAAPRILPGLQDLLDLMLRREPSDRPGAQACLDWFDTHFPPSGIQPGRERIPLFQARPAAYAEAEAGEIAAHFRAKAGACKSGGASRQAATCLSVAEMFACLPNSPLTPAAVSAPVASSPPVNAAIALAGRTEPAPGERLPRRSRRLRKAALFASAALAAAGVGAGTAVFLIRGTGSPPEQRVSATPEKSPAISEMPAVAAVSTQAATLPAAAPKASTRAESERPVHRPVRIKAAARRLIPVVVSLPGYLEVVTRPPFAKVIVDEVVMGETPLQATIELAPGAHDLVLEREGCVPVRKTVYITTQLKSMLSISMAKADLSSL